MDERLRRDDMIRKTASMLLVTGLLAGCAELSDTQRTTTESTLLGTGAGADVGAGVGAVVGAGAGYAWGSHVASKRAAYARQEEYVEALLASARETQEQTRQYNAALTGDIQRLDRETARLGQ